MEDRVQQTQPLNFRAPSNIASESSYNSFELPPLSFILGNWNVTHSTLSMWKSSRNVVISYTPLSDASKTTPGSSASDPSELRTTQLDSVVTYQPLSSDKLKTVKGIETPEPDTPGAYKSRGKGLLKIASSQWELLGWGEDEGGWIVTLFQKTLFTPMGIDFYVRKKGGISQELVDRIKAEMAKVGDEKFAALTKEIFKIRHDWNN